MDLGELPFHHPHLLCLPPPPSILQYVGKVYCLTVTLTSDSNFSLWSVTPFSDMLMSSLFKWKSAEGEPEGPAVQFIAVEHAIDKERAARDKAAMEAEIAAACAHTSFSFSPRTEPPLGIQGSPEDSLVITTTEPITLGLATNVPRVEEGDVPLRKIVDVDALPASSLAHSMATPTRSPTRVPLKKRAGVPTAPAAVSKK